MLVFGRAYRDLASLFICLIWFLTVRVFLVWKSTKLGLMLLLKDTTQWHKWGSNLQPLGLESKAQPLSHGTPLHKLLVLFGFGWAYCG